MFDLFDFAYFRDFNESIKNLAKLADEEDWNFSDDITKAPFMFNTGLS